MAQPESSPEELLDRVFDAFAGGLAQRLAWLAVMDPDGDAEEPATLRHEIADTLHHRTSDHQARAAEGWTPACAGVER